MSGKILSISKGGVGEYKVLDKVYDANWRDDIDVPKEEKSNVIKGNFGSFETYENEENYVNDPSDDKPGSGEKIALFRRNRFIGGRVLDITKLERKAA